MYRTGKRGASGGGGETPAPSGDNGIGFLNYQNTLATQVVSSGTWSTLKNNGAGPFTELRFAPPGVTTMLDPATGRILLDGLMVGDQIYIRHTLSIVPYIRSLGVTFRGYAGQAGQQYEIPFGLTTILPGGAGVPTGLFVADSSFHIRDENTRIGGFLPQIKSDGDCEVEYAGVYIGVMRRMR